VRCPHLAIQSFVKTLCDIHGEPYKPYLCQQFTICYDIYLDVKWRTEAKVCEVLGRGSDWQQRHPCPACTCELVKEEAMIFSMLVCVDSNESLQRVIRREGTIDMDEPKSKERVDERDAGDGYYLSREKVDEWAKTKLADLLPTDNGEKTPCSDWWKNMINDVTSKTWGIFDKTGI
ncbi:hypothetical protein B0H13DRAFT_1458719, partial [Mycena leptocephala]